MKVNAVEKKEKNTVELTVEFGSEEFQEALNRAYKKNRGSIMVPGFRKGKAPRKIIEQMYGGSIFYEDAINILCPDAFEKVVEEEGLKVVGQPSIDDIDISDEKVLTIKFLTALFPEVTLGAYKGLSAPYAEPQVKQEDVDSELEGLQKRNARTVSAERPAVEGDVVIIDFEGFLDGKPFEGGKAEKHELTLGESSFIDGFEEQLTGMQAGEEREITVTFPEKYQEELAGKTVVFKVKMHEVKDRILPELDDEFAKDVSEFDTLDEYRKSIEENFAEERKNAAERQFEEAVMDIAVSNLEVEIPDVMVEQQIDSTMQEFVYRVSSQGFKPEEYLNMMGMTVESFRETSRIPAEMRLKTEMLLSEVARAEKLEVSDEDINSEYEYLAGKYRAREEELRETFPQETVKMDVMRKKAARVIYDSATREEEKADEAAKETDNKAESEE